MRFFDHCLADDRSVLKHVFEIDQIAVMFFLCIIIGVVKMNDSLIVRIHNFFRQQQTHRKVLADLPRHIIALRRIDACIFVGIFLIDFFVAALNERQNLCIGRIGFSRNLTLIAVTHIFLRNLVSALFHNGNFYQILNPLYIDGMRCLLNPLHHFSCHIRNL